MAGSGQEGQVLRWFLTDMLRVGQVNRTDGSQRIILTDLHGMVSQPGASFANAVFEVNPEGQITDTRMPETGPEGASIRTEMVAIWNGGYSGGQTRSAEKNRLLTAVMQLLCAEHAVIVDMLRGVVGSSRGGICCLGVPNRAVNRDREIILRHRFC